MCFYSLFKLLSDVTHDQGNLSVDVVRRIDGVVRVVKQFKF